MEIDQGVVDITKAVNAQNVGFNAFIWRMCLVRRGINLTKGGGVGVGAECNLAVCCHQVSLLTGYARKIPAPPKSI